MMNPSPLVINDLTKFYGSLCAVDTVSFSLREGEIYGLLGPNGAGKTSIISVITTLEEPTNGSVSVFGYDVCQDPKKAKVLTGCVPQELVNYGFFNIEELLHILSGYYGVTKNKDHIEYLIDRLRLGPHRHKRVKELSGGLKRRMLIAKALVHQPKLLLLDEPTAGVDVELRVSLWKFVRELQQQGVSILLTTHYLEEAETLCDRVGILDLGKLKEEGNPKELIRKLTEREVMISLREPIPPVHHPELIEQGEFLLRFKFPASKSIGELIEELPLNIGAIQDLTINEGRLEDAFQKILGGQDETRE